MIFIYLKLLFTYMYVYTCFSLDYFQSKGVSDPHKYFPRELDSNFASSSSQLSELVVKSSVWLESWSKEYLKSKGVKIPREPATNQKRSTLRSTKSQPMMKLPHCEPVEVINHFVKIEHEKELARFVFNNVERAIFQLTNDQVFFLFFFFFFVIVVVVVV